MFQGLYDRVHALREDLGQSAGIDPTEDRRKSGYIQACLDFVATEFEDTGND